MNPFKWLKDEVVAYLCAFLVVALVGLGAAFWMYRADAGRKLEKVRAEAVEIRQDRDACLASLAHAEDVITTQNEAVMILQREAEMAKDAAAEAYRKSRAQEREYINRIAKLRAQKAGPDACLSARNLIVETLKEDRK